MAGLTAMLVVDASCLYEVLVEGPCAQQVRARLLEDDDHAAPHVVDGLGFPVEVPT